MISTIMIDWIIYAVQFFLVLIIVSNKVASFHNDARIFSISKSLGTNCLTLSIGLLSRIS